MSAIFIEAFKNVGQQKRNQYSWINPFGCICTGMKLVFLEWKRGNKCLKKCDELGKRRISINILLWVLHKNSFWKQMCSYLKYKDDSAFRFWEMIVARTTVQFCRFNISCDIKVAWIRRIKLHIKQKSERKIPYPAAACSQHAICQVVILFVFHEKEVPASA